MRLDILLIMIQKQEHAGLVWVDLENPTRDEVKQISEEYGIHPLVGEELLIPSLKPRIDLYRDYMYLILHFPAFRHTHGGRSEQEIDFIIGKKFLITTRYDTIDPVHKFAKVFEVNSILDRGDMGEHAGFIFFYMLRNMYKSIGHELDFMSDALRAIEHRVFSGNEKEMVVEISKMSRELLRFKHALSTHREVLESFGIAAKRFFGEEYVYHAKDIVGSYFRVSEMISGNLEFLGELRETNNSLLSTKQNETMRVLAFVSFILLPLTFVSQLFSMGTKNTPLLGQTNDFWIIIAVLLVVAIGQFIFFKWRRWL